MMMIYALCSFANFGSMGIMIGTFGPLAPERRAEVTSLVAKTILSGTLATCMTGTIVGLLY
jgi:concentrative nucleoside transporter, CNT family